MLPLVKENSTSFVMKKIRLKSGKDTDDKTREFEKRV